MPTAADLLVTKGRQHADRFSNHAETAGMLFYRDVCNKEIMAREAFEECPPTDYKVCWDECV